MCTFYKYIVILSIIFSGFAIHGQETLTKQIDKTFDMTNTGELLLDNKYGDVSFTGWDKNKIVITANIKVTHKKRDHAKTLLNRIEVESKSAGDFLSITSIISEKNSNFFSRYFNKVNPFEFDKSNVDINYTVYLPINAEIEIINKFGNVVIDNWTGKLKANIEHGDLWVNDTISNAKITMKFGKLRGKSMTYSTVNLKNGGINIKQSKVLLLNTSGVSIDLGKVTDLEIISSKDNITIQEVGRIKGQLEYSNAKIEALEDTINLSMSVAELWVSKILNTNPEVNIDQESSDIHIDISDLSFKFEATLEQGLLRLPKTVSNLENIVIDKGKRIRKIKGLYGASTSGIFNFQGRKGIIVLDD
ncbi:hypothetical protein VOI54_14020 [Tamlana sp. 2201CG12-4]|uniref:hypothetical protein n=1 Tax=Tamlana sp. 2201CG12-4 TaxID=3112582 RepID=UPI002DB638AF|nr:hypothetical protein [Tamlana sp. 2201CG12-4]MEC3908143.1 hypothetical protein [Tamlana sp. 2201CG12-4]